MRKPKLKTTRDTKETKNVSMDKSVLKMVVAVFCVVAILKVIPGFQTTQNQKVYNPVSSYDAIVNVPLKQKKVITTDKLERVNAYIKQGFVLQYVNIVAVRYHYEHDKVKRYYTIVRY